VIFLTIVSPSFQNSEHAYIIRKQLRPSFARVECGLGYSGPKGEGEMSSVSPPDNVKI
jgi:hypothetical protein